MFAISSSATSLLYRRRGVSGSRPSQRTKAVWAKLQPYFADERKKGVLAVDAQNPSTLLAHEAGYIDRDNEVIVGLQTDQPFKRAIFPYGGLRMVETGLKAAGFEPDPSVHEAFTKYRKSHNDGVFDAYTPEIMNCRRSGIITGLPDCLRPRPHHRRLRRVALYGIDRLLEVKRSGAGPDRRHVADRRNHPVARRTGRADARAQGSRLDGEALRLRHHRSPPRMRRKPSSGLISPIWARSRKPTARQCRSDASRASSISISSAT